MALFSIGPGCATYLSDDHDKNLLGETAVIRAKRCGKDFGVSRCRHNSNSFSFFFSFRSIFFFRLLPVVELGFCHPD